MKLPHPTLWLQHLLSGLEPEARDLDRLIDECGPEGEHHDFKSGLVATWKPTDPKNAPALLRKYVSGFANSDGGFLVIGYNEKAKQVDGFKPPGGGSAHDWATRTLSDLYLSPSPRIRVVAYDGARLAPGIKAPVDVLIVTAERASVLVPCREGPRWMYFLRLGDSTLEVPSYLAADLLLGRRSRPTLAIRGAPEVDGVRGVAVDLGTDPNPNLSSGNTLVYPLTLRVVVANEGFLSGEDVRVGAIGWTIHYARRREPTSFLRTRIEPRQPAPRLVDQEEDLNWRLAHTYYPDGPRATPVMVRPFESQVFDLVDRPFCVPIARGATARSLIELALYAIARDSEPWWFQLKVRLAFDVTSRSWEAAAELEPCGSRLPIVSWAQEP